MLVNQLFLIEWLENENQLLMSRRVSLEIESMGRTEWCGVAIDLIDTGGYIFNDANEFNSPVRLQAEEAISESNFVLFMVDGQDGLTQTDKEISQIVRKSGKPYFCIVNKCDTLKSDTQKNSFYELGMKNAPFSISALNGRNSGDLLDMIIKELGSNKYPFNKRCGRYIGFVHCWNAKCWKIIIN